MPKLHVRLLITENVPEDYLSWNAMPHIHCQSSYLQPLMLDRIQVLHSAVAMQMQNVYSTQVQDRTDNEHSLELDCHWLQNSKYYEISRTMHSVCVIQVCGYLNIVLLNSDPIQ